MHCHIVVGQLLRELPPPSFSICSRVTAVRRMGYHKDCVQVIGMCSNNQQARLCMQYSEVVLCKVHRAPIYIRIGSVQVDPQLYPIMAFLMSRADSKHLIMSTTKLWCASFLDTQDLQAMSFELLSHILESFPHGPCRDRSCSRTTAHWPRRDSK